MRETVAICTVPTGWGEFCAAVSNRGLGCLTFPGDGVARCQAWRARWLPGARVVAEDGRLDALGEQLRAYLDGDLREFSLPLDRRGTAFQLRVWESVAGIPYGTTVSYADVAKTIGRPREARAVGAANGANPIPIVVPCHRVVGSNGRLVGYGGGLELKWRLLELEGAVLPLGGTRRP